jgi:hypothetical protein
MGNMNTMFKRMVMESDIPYAVKHNGLRFRTFHVVKVSNAGEAGPPPKEIGRVTAAFWPKLDGDFGDGKTFETAFSFCAGIDLPRFDHDEGEVRAYQRLIAQDDIFMTEVTLTGLHSVPKPNTCGRARHEFFRENGKMIKDQLKLLVIKEAVRRGVPWMKDVVFDDLK